MQETSRIRITGAAIGLAAGLGLGLFGGKAISQADAKLGEDHSYQRMQECAVIRDDISNAESELDYRAAYTTHVPMKVGSVTIFTPIHHPANYPDPQYAIQSLDKAVADYNRNPQNSRDMAGLDSRLEIVSTKLPAELDLRQYKGSSVDDSTFQAERQALNQEAADVGQIVARYDSQVPSSLKNAKTTGIVELVGGILLGLGSAGLIVNEVTKEDGVYY
jgi:hypothetical protein